MASEGNIRALLEGQRAYFESGRTLPVSARIQALEGLERSEREDVMERKRRLRALREELVQMKKEWEQWQ